MGSLDEEIDAVAADGGDADGVWAKADSCGSYRLDNRGAADAHCSETVACGSKNAGSCLMAVVGKEQRLRGHVAWDSRREKGGYRGWA